MSEAQEIREKLDKFQEELNSRKSNRDRSVGVLSANMKTLEKDFGFKNVAAAEKQLTKWEEEKENLEKKLKKQTEEFIGKYMDEGK